MIKVKKVPQKPDPTVFHALRLKGTHGDPLISNMNSLKKFMGKDAPYMLYTNEKGGSLIAYGDKVAYLQPNWFVLKGGDYGEYYCVSDVEFYQKFEKVSKPMCM